MRDCAAIGMAVFLLSCGDSPAGSGGPGSVEIVYEAATALDTAVAARFPGCVQGVGQTHVHPSWRGFQRFTMTAVGTDRWEINFDDALVGTELRIRVSDPNVCAQNPTGASTNGVRANGQLLSRIVDTPGSGVEPGLAFVLSGDGTVIP